MLNLNVKNYIENQRGALLDEIGVMGINEINKEMIQAKINALINGVLECIETEERKEKEPIEDSELYSDEELKAYQQGFVESGYYVEGVSSEYEIDYPEDYVGYMA